MLNLFIGLWPILFGFLLTEYDRVEADTSKIDSGLLTDLENGDKANVLVFFIKKIQPVLDRANYIQQRSSRNHRNQVIFESLREHMEASQQGVVHILSEIPTGGEAGGYRYFKQYWTSNKMFIRDATFETIKAVAEDPQVLKIKTEPTGVIEEPDPKPPSKEGLITREVPEAYEEGLWGIQSTSVKDAWAELEGNQGEGVLVATIDSGVIPSHEALRDSFVGLQYGWYDGVDKFPEAVDSSGHGTHTMGVIVGDFGIGVAPGAKWMTCQACNDKCPGEALLDCIQFLACPTLPDGSSPNCTKAPDIISNSWVLPRGTDDFKEDIYLWRALGIIPVFAIGNNDLALPCNSTQAPGEYPFVIGVGASNKFEELHWASAVGWASDGGIKPDLVAPGAGVVSSHSYNDTTYKLISGTSIATPFVAGVIALLKVRNPDLSYEEAYEFITNNTDTIILQPNLKDNYCNDTSKDDLPTPNVFFGYGRVNALKAVKAQTEVIKRKELERKKHNN